ncbi:ABC transporter permease [Allopusillimonas soli]|uniref:ABC transporter permease n=1 Tax=Allopusillimonas soli TaxID=659016 RepID=A0A853FCU2_9BURK|nr:ABC transporter permease [Allopusillimonas soli]NYT38615.1 ABC transporter permease [Allopusillimonas soli]TEA71673.1 ABC transporter permease [Allopusillimonas soli]
MHFSGLVVQVLNGLAEASSLFLVAAGLSLIFGVSRIVNFAHGSLYMLGLYVAYTLVAAWGNTAPGYWLAILAAALVIGVLGALIEILLLRRIYQAPEMFQLLATFGLVLLFNDLALWLWGPDDLLGPLAPGLEGSLPILGRYLPVYDILLMVVGPAVLLALWWVLARTRWGMLVRAATQDREMLGALGVNQAWLFTGVFAFGALLAGLGGAMQVPRQPASLMLDLSIIGDVFVVVVVGGMGSLPGAYLAAVIIAQLKALCISLGVVEIGGISIAFPRLTLVIEFIFMAVVLTVRPWGLCGRPLAISRHIGPPAAPLASLRGAGRLAAALALAALLALPLLDGILPYLPILAQDVLIAILFAVSLHAMMGLGGMPSFGHAAYFGLGAYGAALLFQSAGVGMLPAIALAPMLACVAAMLFGLLGARLTGVYLAMLTLAFAQIIWSIAFQWDDVTGGSNGLFGVWPEDWLSGRGYYYFTLLLVSAAVILVRRAAFSPYGMALRATRDSVLRASASGMPVRRIQWVSFVAAGTLAGLAGALYVFAKGGTSPEVMTVGKSVEALVMVMLGGIQSLSGPVIGGAVFTVLQDFFVGVTEYWHALFGLVILLVVLAFPQGIAGWAAVLKRREGRP